jgi:hypothetical protein
VSDLFGDERLPRRFWSKVAVNGNTGCWEWTAAKTNGYGRYGIGPRRDYHLLVAHRYAYSVLIGPVPDEMHCDHLCRNRQCVNPAHLEVVTQRENKLRGDGTTAVNAAKTHCTRGHELDGDNLRVILRPDVDGVARFIRKCRECTNMHSRLADQRRRERGERRDRG